MCKCSLKPGDNGNRISVTRVLLKREIQLERLVIVCLPRSWTCCLSLSHSTYLGRFGWLVGKSPPVHMSERSETCCPFLYLGILSFTNLLSTSIATIAQSSRECVVGVYVGVRVAPCGGMWLKATGGGAVTAGWLEAGGGVRIRPVPG